MIRIVTSPPCATLSPGIRPCRDPCTDRRTAIPGPASCRLLDPNVEASHRRIDGVAVEEDRGEEPVVAGRQAGRERDCETPIGLPPGSAGGGHLAVVADHHVARHGADLERVARRLALER